VALALRLAMKIGPMNGREARESGLRLLNRPLKGPEEGAIGGNPVRPKDGLPSAYFAGTILTAIIAPAFTS
jgi:hypothetical protein